MRAGRPIFSGLDLEGCINERGIDRVEGQSFGKIASAPKFKIALPVFAKILAVKILRLLFLPRCKPKP